MMKKGFAAAILVAVLTVGTVALANSWQTAQPQSAAPGSSEMVIRPETPARSTSADTSAPAATPKAESREVKAQAAPAATDRKADSMTLHITDLGQDVADQSGATVNLQAGGTLRNNSKRTISLSEVRVMLQDGEGKVAIPARIEVLDGSKDTLERGEEVKVRLTFGSVPVDAGPVKMVLNSPVGGAVTNGLTIHIHCTYPPLRCRIWVTFD